jgi:radical SAM family uncharacterized protein/radical SAM-linked protein
VIPNPVLDPNKRSAIPTGHVREDNAAKFSKTLTEDLLEKVVRPGQYLGNEWGAIRKDFDQTEVRLALAFPDLYELGMSNFGLKILYQIVNRFDNFYADRSYAPGSDMEELLRQRSLPLWAWESRRPLKEFELVGFSLQYELTYTNVLNMLELSEIPLLSKERTSVFPLIFGGGPSAVNPEPMADFIDFFMIGDGERSVPAALEVIRRNKFHAALAQLPTELQRKVLLWQLGTNVPGLYVPQFYAPSADSRTVAPMSFSEVFADFLGEMEAITFDPPLSELKLPERVLRQTEPLSNSNQPVTSLVPYLSLVHDREVLEVRRGCDRGCRFCQPGYTFLPVRERSSEDLLELSKQAMANSGHDEYSMLSLCVSDYTTLHDSVRALNEEHSKRRSSLSFPSQRADRMSLDLAEELKAVRKSGITLAPEAGTERMRAVINKGLSHTQIISAIEAAYQSGWASVKLYFMCGLPTERDEDLRGIVDILKEAAVHCRVIRKSNIAKYKKELELTCTISNFVPKPFTPFQWFGAFTPEEMDRKHKVLRGYLKESGLKRVTLNVTDSQISLLETVISRGDRSMGQLILRAFKAGATFDAWDDKFKPQLWHDAAGEMGWSLVDIACTDREVGSPQPWDVVHIGLHTWWLVKEWEKSMATLETAPCSENTCHACGVCTELEVTHELAAPKPEVLKRNPFVKELDQNQSNEDGHPSLFFEKKQQAPPTEAYVRMRFKFTKVDELRFISHLDMQSLFTRAARRAGLMLAYSQGFNPQPKITIAAPLALFHESVAEVGEMELGETMSPETFRDRLNAKLPSEVQVIEALAVPVGKKDSLTSRLSAATYEATLAGLDTAGDADTSTPQGDLERLGEEISQRATEIMAAHSLMVKTVQSPHEHDTKHGGWLDKPAEKDLRPLVKEIKVIQQNPLTLAIKLAHGSRAHLKPADLLSQLHLPEASSKTPVRWKLKRTALHADDESDLYTI